jgi:hypothetical protein
MIRIVAMLLVSALLLPMGVGASATDTVQPRASYYLDSYNAYVYPAGNGKIQVYFSVIGTDYMDTLGSLRIEIYESTDNSNWIWKRTFTNESNPELLGYDHYFYGNHVDYQGVAGRYYRAYVCIWAGKDGDGDTRYFYTSSKLAT